LMTTSYLDAILILAGALSLLITQIAGYIKLAGEAKFLHAKVDEIGAKVDGQFDKARAETEEAVRKLADLRRQVDRGETSIEPEDALETIKTAEAKASKLLEVASLAAAVILKDAKDTAVKLGPAKVKAAALDAVQTAVENEIARAAPPVEVRKLDEH
jgi:hypothetical protein